MTNALSKDWKVNYLPTFDFQFRFFQGNVFSEVF